MRSTVLSVGMRQHRLPALEFERFESGIGKVFTESLAEQGFIVHQDDEALRRAGRRVFSTARSPRRGRPASDISGQNLQGTSPLMSCDMHPSLRLTVTQRDRLSSNRHYSPPGTQLIRSTTSVSFRGNHPGPETGREQSHLMARERRRGPPFTPCLGPREHSDDNSGLVGLSVVRSCGLGHPSHAAHSGRHCCPALWPHSRRQSRLGLQDEAPASR